MKSILIVVCIFILSSCSSTSFYSSGKVNIAQARVKSFSVTEDVIIAKEFYLWGTVPRSQKVELDPLILARNHLRLMDVTITKYRTKEDLIASLFSFGLYSPVHYHLQFRGEKFEDENL